MTSSWNLIHKDALITVEHLPLWVVEALQSDCFVGTLPMSAIIGLSVLNNV